MPSAPSSHHDRQGRFRRTSVAFAAWVRPGKRASYGVRRTILRLVAGHGARGWGVDTCVLENCSSVSSGHYRSDGSESFNLVVLFTNSSRSSTSSCPRGLRGKLPHPLAQPTVIRLRLGGRLGAATHQPRGSRRDRDAATCLRPTVRSPAPTAVIVYMSTDSAVTSLITERRWALQQTQLVLVCSPHPH